MKLITNLIVIMMMTLLYSCGSSCPIIKIPELKPIDKVTFAQPRLNCLGRDLKVVVVDRIKNCETRMETLEGQIRSFNKTPTN